jgi:hypothetical protein
MNKKILRTKEAEISKAGRLVFDAIFGDSDALERRLADEADAATPDAAPGDALTVEGHSFVRCAGCAREQTVPENVDVRTLEQRGWRLAGGAWRCSFCVVK